MRIPCPICGPRDLREFTYQGADLECPEGAVWDGEWHRYLHLRENPAGWTTERWYHEAGCGAWIVVERNTVTHEIRSARPAASADALAEAAE